MVRGQLHLPRRQKASANQHDDLRHHLAVDVSEAEVPYVPGRSDSGPYISNTRSGSFDRSIKSGDDVE
jgi:hypothetical protein